MLGCNPADVAARLKLAMEVFQNARSQVACQWNDGVHEQFEEQYLTPMETKFHRALETIGRLAERMREMERDCS